MFPYTPLQYLLFDAGAPDVLVMTSANRSSEPIAYEDQDALDHLTGIADAFLCLVAVGVLLGRVRAATGNIAACIGLHAGWVWVMLVVHALAQPVRTAPLGFLLSRFDGFVGWLVLAWTIPLGLALQWFYSAGTGVRGASLSSR